MTRLTVNATLGKPQPARSGESGQVLALFALFLVVFLGFAAVTIDYGS